MRIRTWGICLLGLSLLTLGSLLWLRWQKDAPRRKALGELQEFAQALEAGHAAAFLNRLALPTFLSGRTEAEQAEFVTKALRDEISDAGLRELSRHAEYGPLLRLFPAEATNWTQQAGVRPEDCSAFRMERDGQRAEVVLLNGPTNTADAAAAKTASRIVRINNVKQMVKP